MFLTTVFVLLGGIAIAALVISSLLPLVAYSWHEELVSSRQKENINILRKYSEQESGNSKRGEPLVTVKYLTWYGTSGQRFDQLHRWHGTGENARLLLRDLWKFNIKSGFFLRDGILLLLDGTVQYLIQILAIHKQMKLAKRQQM